MAATVNETWQHQTLETNGIRMHYVTEGQGPLLILLHGFPQFWYAWRHQISALAHLGYKVVAPDMRGYNETDKPKDGYDMKTLVDDVKGLIEGLGYQEAIVAGHDWGGVVAWNFAINYPAMLSKLIIINAPHPNAFKREIRTLAQLRKSSYMFFFALPWLPEFYLGRCEAVAIANVLKRHALHKETFSTEDLLVYRKAASKPGAIAGMLGYYRAALTNSQSLKKRIHAPLTLPTLLIWGENDAALGLPLTQGLDAWVKSLQLQTIPDCGHFTMEEKSERVTELMVDFLKP